MIKMPQNPSACGASLTKKNRRGLRAAKVWEHSVQPDQPKKGPTILTEPILSFEAEKALSEREFS